MLNSSEPGFTKSSQQSHIACSKSRVVWNPVCPALRPYFDPALIDPVEDANLVCDAGVVGGVPPTEFEVREEGREIVLALGFPTYC
jgi:hypothetical protein